MLTPARIRKLGRVSSSLIIDTLPDGSLKYVSSRASVLHICNEEHLMSTLFLPVKERNYERVMKAISIDISFAWHHPDNSMGEQVDINVVRDQLREGDIRLVELTDVNGEHATLNNDTDYIQSTTFDISRVIKIIWILGMM